MPCMKTCELYESRVSVTMPLPTRWASVVPPCGDFWQQSSFPNVSLAPNDSGRASVLPICPSYASAGRLDSTTDANFSVKPKLVATLAHRLNWNESPRSGASSFLLPLQSAKDRLALFLLSPTL